MDRHAVTRRLRQLAHVAGVPISRPHPHMLRHTFVTTMQIGRIASDASFGRSREHALPAPQRVALRGARRVGCRGAAVTWDFIARVHLMQR